VLVVPIIENTEREAELTESMAKAMFVYPDTNAVLVRYALMMMMMRFVIIFLVMF
jgi:hypothetical protein